MLQVLPRQSLPSCSAGGPRRHSTCSAGLPPTCALRRLLHAPAVRRTLLAPCASTPTHLAGCSTPSSPPTWWRRSTALCSSSWASPAPPSSQVGQGAGGWAQLGMVVRVEPVRCGIDHSKPSIQLPPLCYCTLPPAGTLQFACLIWAGAAQANRVRRLYLASLLSQVRMTVEG